LNHCDFPVT